MFSFTDGTVFNMVSVDLAEYSTVVPVLTVLFVGYRHDGSIVTTNMTPDGIIDGTGPLADFETFYFGPEFSNLDRVEIPTYGWSLDNLYVSVPEPATGMFLLAGGLLLWRLRRIRFARRGVNSGACVIFLVTTQCWSQGTLEPLHITFDGPPPQPVGTATLVSRYDEAGMAFTHIDPSGLFGRRGGRSFFAENGTTYLHADLETTLKFSFINGTVFNLVSVDLAEFSTTVTNAKVLFVGYRHDGTIVTTDLTTDGIIDGTGPLADFETFYFGPEFSNLDRVEIPTYGWSLDNLVVSVPEPTSGILLAIGGLVLGALKLRHRRLKRREAEAIAHDYQQTTCGLVFTSAA